MPLTKSTKSRLTKLYLKVILSGPRNLADHYAVPTPDDGGVAARVGRTGAVQNRRVFHRFPSPEQVTDRQHNQP
jgi:hypothetical protein